MPEEDFHKKNTEPGVPREDSSYTPHEIPKYIGPYKIESLLEKGGMSLLYLGTHPETKDPTTIKVLLPRFLSHPDIVKRFLTEAEIIALADHPNIVRLYGHGEWEGGLYIAMEFIEGISLRQFLLQSPMSLKRAIEITIDIAYALCHLHTHGVIHRDLKPENVLVTTSEQIKVIDFGIAQLLTENSLQTSQEKRRLIGTPVYMSPEQRDNPESVSYPSDIYSLGIITYELVLGKLCHGQIHLSLMPKGLQKILNKALQPNPQSRYLDIVDFITDISAYLHSTDISKEMKGADHLSELSEDLKYAQLLLTPPLHSPFWQGLEVGLVTHKGPNINGAFYDFFTIEQNLHGIVLGESSARGARGIVYASILKGMSKSLYSSTIEPIEFIKKMNRLILDERHGQVFAFTLLLISTNENRFRYVSCGHGNLWKIDPSSTNPVKFANQNPALGVHAEENWQETQGSFEVNDTLILITNQNVTPDTSNQDFSEEVFKQSILENLGVPPQKSVETVMRRLKITAGKYLQSRALILIQIKRVT